MTNPRSATTTAVTLLPMFIDDILAPEPAAQAIPRRRFPSLELACAVIEQAIENLVGKPTALGGYGGAGRARKGGRVAKQTYQWIMSNSRADPYSFLNLCDHVKVEPSLIREHICEALTKRPQHPLTNQEE